ncbi:MAG: pilus assembly protein CpaE [Frankiales bacterium]|jgi:pilus assembly protein CpaE|nr:pilus assembly protein CpaE [Frankiales bacterium]
MAILVEGNPETATLLHAAAGGGERVENLGSLRRVLERSNDDVVVVGPDIDLEAALEFAASVRVAEPARGFVLVRRRVDATVLSQALRAGVREVVGADNLQALNEACRASAEISRQFRQGRGDAAEAGGSAPALATHISVFSAKGGCGKTTVATNLAAALAAQGHRVCLLDLDLAFGDVAIALQLFPSRTMADAVALSGRIDRTAIESLTTPHSHNLDTLLAPLGPGLADTISGATVTEVIRVAKTMYDVVIADTPPAFTDHVLATFDESDMFLLLATLDVPAVKNLKLTLETLDMLGSPKEHRVVVLNRADAQVGLVVADVAKMLGTPVGVQVPSSRAVPASVNKGIPLVMDQPNHAVSQVFRKFAKERFPRPAARGAKRSGDHRGFSMLRRGGGS